MDKIWKSALPLQAQSAFQLSIFHCRLILSNNVFLEIDVIRLIQFFLG